MTDKNEVLANLKLLSDELKNKRGPANRGAPQIILIGHDDYHATEIGRTKDNLQFFITSMFVPAIGGKPGCEFMATYLFNTSGDLVNSKVDNLGPRANLAFNTVSNAKQQHIKALGPIKYLDIQVKPFAVEHYGLMMGLIPSKFEGRWWVELLPGNCMAFHEPWDSGIYDT